MRDNRLIPMTICDTGNIFVASLMDREMILHAEIETQFSVNDHATYHGDYIVIPKVDIEQDLLTAGMLMEDDVKVRAIPYYETSNMYGKTVYIGEDYI